MYSGVDHILLNFLSLCLRKQMSASVAIRHFADIHMGDLHLICLGPLTNLAEALANEPNLGRKLKSCTIMGGNAMGIGNFGWSYSFTASHLIVTSFCLITYESESIRLSV